MRKHACELLFKQYHLMNYISTNKKNSMPTAQTYQINFIRIQRVVIEDVGHSVLLLKTLYQ